MIRRGSLFAITPGDARPDLDAWIAAVAGAGADAVVIREPDLSEGDVRDLAHAVRGHTTRVILHARTRGAPPDGPLGLHLPAAGSVRAARAAVRGLLGRSCHTPAQAHDALAAGADYVFLSPVWRPASKPGDVRAPLGPDRLVAVAAGRPVLALGGVTPERFATLIARGVTGAAVLGPLRGAPEAAADAVRAYRRAADAFLTPRE